MKKMKKMNKKIIGINSLYGICKDLEKVKNIVYSYDNFYNLDKMNFENKVYDMKFYKKFDVKNLNKIGNYIINLYYKKKGPDLNLLKNLNNINLVLRGIFYD